MALYESRTLKNIYSNRINQLRKGLDNLILEHVRGRVEFDIFLSHSFLDKEEVGGLFFDLTDMGYSVYVDWIIDYELSRASVDKNTCDTVKARMNQSKCLFYSISLNAGQSKWMPWELGYMDGLRDKCAILPVNKSYYQKSSFEGVEYLSVYPYAYKQNDTNGISRIWIEEEPEKYVIFDAWLNGNKPFKR
jgi:hypothetical protein